MSAASLAPYKVVDGTTQLRLPNRVLINGPSVAGGELVLQPSDHTNSAGSIQFKQVASSGRYNWLAGADIVTSNAWDLASSTAVDGATFTNVMIRATGAGALTLGRTGGTIALYGGTPAARAAHIPDAAGGTEVATINAILTVLRNLNAIASS